MEKTKKYNICNNIKDYPRVSIIVPALNEENNISKCIEKLLDQDYHNFEIVAVNDSSSDMTGEIMQAYLKSNPKRMSVITANPKPVDWIGKNWACYQGYLNATGEIFVFTDADTIISSPSTISLAVSYFVEGKLDALTGRPNIVAHNIWTKITLPILWTFSHIKYSALSVNNERSKSSYLFGCFYLINRKTYESIGTHKAVKDEIVEDVALGKKIKQQKFKLKMVRAEDQITTLMTGNFMSLWEGLKRSINLIPFYHNDVTNILVVLLLLLEPFILFPFSCHLLLTHYDNLSKTLFAINILTIVLIISISATQLVIGLLLNPIYALLCPIACVLVSISFVSFIIKARCGGIVKWRGRAYIANGSVMDSCK
ncbi:MAG TPA: glycosyltransferase family 2 protein [Nitrososphaeraceae archaeon]|nr:glycosyltransferase family 2 protein [Nitrososphaeraceae archaeon]